MAQTLGVDEQQSQDCRKETEKRERRDKYERFKIYLHLVLICPVLGVAGMLGDGSGRACGAVLHSLPWDPSPVGTSLWTLAQTVCCSLPSLALVHPVQAGVGKRFTRRAQVHDVI